MVRTQVYLDEEQHKELKLRSEELGTNVSKLIREGVDLILHHEDRKQASRDPLIEMIGQIDGGEQDSKEVDQVIYGTK